MTIESLVRRLSAPVIVFLLTLASTVATVHAAENPRKMTVVSFGLFGDEGVFRREATGAAQIVANRFGGDPVVVKYNTKTGGSATVETLATTLQAEAKKMNGESDILFLILTSHGSRDGLAVVAGRLAETLKPSHLSEMLGRTGVRNKVVIISACYSGVFIPRLADADTLVITAADANHPSFGCEDKAKWTYFGDAFFNAALRRANNLKDAFLMARSLVLRRELREGFEPSHPQMAGGGKVEPLLVAHPLGIPGVGEIGYMSNRASDLARRTTYPCRPQPHSGQAPGHIGARHLKRVFERIRPATQLLGHRPHELVRQGRAIASGSRISRKS